MKNSGIKFLIVLLIIVAIIAGVLLALKIMQDKQTSSGEIKENEQIQQQEPVKTVKTFSGEERAIALMIDNHEGAWPQGGLNDADLVYEIIVEGGETRLMAVFKGKNLEKIGPVRSARHYFIDYALENDAIYTHFGWSPQAESDIKTYSVNNINGITETSESFWRTTDKYAPHNVATSTEKILEIAERKGYRTTSNQESVLNYVTDEVNLEDGTAITKVTIPYSYLQEVSYEYDEENKVFVRYARGEKQIDWNTKQPVTTKNIIITFAQNYSLNDAENKGRQGLKNIGTLDGYYITNGKYILIKCEKTDRTSQTIYKDLDGNEIEVNDGNTFIQIWTLDAKVGFEEVVQKAPTNMIEQNKI